jgi:hypothetical protein
MVARAIEQRRHADRREDVTDVDAVVHALELEAGSGRAALAQHVRELADAELVGGGRQCPSPLRA